MNEKPRYVVRGRRQNGEIVFYSIDSNSGYPYSSRYDYKTTNNLMEAMGWLSEATGRFCSMVQAEICQIKFEPVNIESYQKDMIYVDNLWENQLNDTQREYLKNKLKG